MTPERARVARFVCHCNPHREEQSEDEDDRLTNALTAPRDDPERDEIPRNVTGSPARGGTCA